MASNATNPNKWTHTPRKVFDKYCDRMEIKIARIKEDYRADLVALLARIRNLEDQLIKYFPIEDAEEADN